MKIPLFLLAACAALVSAPLLAQPVETVPTSAPAAAPRPGPKVGEMAPDFTVVGPDGREMKLSDFRGKTVLIDIWATWCGPCVASMPHNSALAEKHAKDGLVILAVCADDSRANYDGWVKRNAGKYKFLTAHDTPGKDGWDKSVFNTAYGVTGFPTLFLIDKDGKLVGQTSGGGPGENPHVTRLLAKGGVPVDTSHLPPEETGAAKSVPMMGKTMAMPAGGKTAALSPPTIKLGNLKFDDEVPDFAAVGIDGREVKLSSFKGNPVLVAFWTGARSPGDDFAKLQAAYKDQGLAVWAINVATERPDFDTWARANAAALGYTVSWDPAGKAIMETISYMKFGIGMYPAFMVVDAKGFFRGGLIGMGPKITAWTRHSLIMAGLKPTAEDKAAADQALNEMFAARDKAAAPAGGGMLLPPVKAPAAPFRESYGKLQAGQPVPDFTVMTPEGKEAKFSAYAKGKTVVLDFWATWCGPCQQAMPHYEEIHRKYADKGVVILGVCAFDTRANYDKWLAETKGKYTFATVFDPVGKPAAGDQVAMDRTIMKQLTQGMISPLPTTLVINPAGQLVGSYMGYGEGTHDTLSNLLMLAGVPVADADKPKVFFPAGSTRQAVAAAAPKPATLAAGAVAPDFVMRDINDKEVRLSDFKGKVVILDFWATWCGPCIASFPHTQDLAAKYADQDVVVLASGTSDTIAKFKEWIPKNQPKYPNLRFTFDPHERDSATFEQRASSQLYGVVGIPTQFIIGRDGKITATVVGNGGKDDARTEAALARAGVKVDAARVEAGEKALKAAAEAETNRLAAAKEEEKNPTPKFRVSYGKLTQGQPVPDFTAESPDGAAVKFSELTKGKTTVFMVWSAAGGPTAAALDYVNGWAQRYADQGVLFVGLGAYGSREDFAKWHAANGAKLAFPALFDPVGMPPKPAMPMEEMTEEARTAFREASRAHYAKVIPMAIAGGVMAPVPNNVVIDAKGNFVGFYVGAGPGAAESLGNLLLRAGIKLKPEDLPPKVFSAEETKEKPPEAKVEMLKIGAMAPDFPATDAAGKAIKVSDYRGKVVILDFWATWCGPCIASMPHTQEVAAHYKDQGVVVLASCTADDRKKFDAWVKANQPLYPDINFSHDPEERGPGRAAHKLYGVGGIPQQFIIDREGKIAALVTGYLKGETILDAALAQAGIKVDPALIEKAALDLKKREMMR